MATEVKLPELGENVSSAEILRVLIAPGDTVEKEQAVLEVETDKATIEVPSSATGVVQDVRVKAGDRVESGQVLFTIDGASAPEPPSAGGEGAPEPAVTKASAEPAPTAAPVADASTTTDAAPGRSSPGRTGSTGAESSVAASPSVRRLARELGVSIADVPGSGTGGRISADDVKAHARLLVSHAASPGGSAAASMAAGEPPLPDFSAWGEIERVPMSGIRRTTAARLSQAWNTIPHVTQHDKADVTQLDTFRKKYGRQVEAAGGVLTITAMLVRVVAAALRSFPQFNSSVDMAGQAVIRKRYVSIGVAVDTDRGLLVPVIREADTKSLTDVSVEIAQLARKARDRQLTLEDMQGGTFTISNLGGLGGTAFSPIVNWPEVAILGVSRAAKEPVFADGGFQPRLMLPLSLSYDHRAIDGADAVRFLRWIVDALEQPMLMSLGG